MSEFTAICPMCRQQILCDTAYVGMRVACPICLHEITMPTPQQHSQPQNPVGANLPGASGGKSSPVILIAAIGGVVLVIGLAVAGIMIAYNRGVQTATPKPSPPPVVTLAQAPQPAAKPAPTAPPDPNVYTNRLTLDTKSFTVKITEVRQKDVSNCLSVSYDGVDKTYHRGIVIKGEDAYAMGTNGTPDHFIGWTFKNGNVDYFVSDEGELRVVQGTNVLVSEQGKWKQKPKR